MTPSSGASAAEFAGQGCFVVLTVCCFSYKHEALPLIAIHYKTVGRGNAGYSFIITSIELFDFVINKWSDCLEELQSTVVQSSTRTAFEFVCRYKGELDNYAVPYNTMASSNIVF